MWESRRDFQRVWEEWEAGFMAFHAPHSVISMACFGRVCLHLAALLFRSVRDAEFAHKLQEARSSVPIGQRFEAPVRSPPFYGARWNAHGLRLLTAHAPAYYRLAAGFTWKPSSISTCDRWATALTRVFAPAASAIATAARRS